MNSNSIVKKLEEIKSNVGIILDSLDEPTKLKIVVAKFRQGCLSEENKITCDNQFLHDRWLITKRLAKIWWLLTDTEREIIADFVTRNYLHFVILYWRSGQPECKGGTEKWTYAACVQNAIIRYLRFGKGEEHYEEMNSYYWSKPDKKDEHCYWEESFDLPVFITDVVAMGGGYGHSICAIQIKEDKKNFSSWWFFQYWNTNIKPGNWQMPCKRSYQGKENKIQVRINKPIKLSSGGYSHNVIATWIINKDTCEPVLDE